MVEKENPREAYQEKLQAQLQNLEAKIKILKSKVQQASAESKHKARGRIQKAKKEYEKTQDRIKEFRTATSEARQDLQGEVEVAMASLREAVDEAIDQFG